MNEDLKFTTAGDYMSDWSYYNMIVAKMQLRPYIEGENLRHVYISEVDEIEYGSPKLGDMIGRDPDNHDVQWLVEKSYFEQVFEPL